MIENAHEDGSDHEDPDEDFDDASDDDSNDYSDEASAEDVPIDVLLARLEHSNWRVRSPALEALGKLEPTTLAKHAGAVVARLEDSDSEVRYYALLTLGKLEPATLAQYADPVVAMLEDSNVWSVRETALETLGKLEPATLAQHADALIAMLEDYDERMRGRALDLLRGLPRFVTRRVDIFDSRPVRSRLLGRLGWYRYRLRMRVRRLALYWYALPYRPSGPGHARDMEAWEQMNTE